MPEETNIEDAIRAVMQEVVADAVAPLKSEMTSLISEVSVKLQEVQRAVDELQGTPPIDPDPTPEPDPIPDPTPDPAPDPDPGVISSSFAVPSMGVNLSRVAYYSSAWPFADAMMTRRAWEHSGDHAWTLLFRGVEGYYPAGMYEAVWQGKGTVSVSGDAEGRSYSSTGGDGIISHMPFKVTKPTNDGIMVRIAASDRADPVRDMRVYMPGIDPDVPPLFHHQFLEALKPFSTLRFMDWGMTNDSPLKTWEERTKLNDTQYGDRGVAYEYMFELCNELGVHPWICIPHLAQTDFINKLAELASSMLDPALRVLVEYSNELWNYGFSQAEYLRDVAGGAKSTYEVQARHSRTVFDVFSAHFSAHRLTRVVAAQAGNPWISEQILKHIPEGGADALAIAPYFGHRLGRDAGVANWSVDQVLDFCEKHITEEVVPNIKRHAQIAEDNGLALVAYEGGQHLVGVSAQVENQAMTNLFHKTNSHVRMGQLYKSYLEAWADNGGGLFCAFNDCYLPNKHGSWGLLEYQDQPVSEAHKYRAAAEIAGQWRERD